MMEELLHILEKNARLPVEDIAAMMGKTPAQVAAMMDEAVAKGYIRGFDDRLGAGRHQRGGSGDRTACFPPQEPRL